MEWIHTLKNGGAFFSFYEVISIFIMVIWTGKFWKSRHRTGVEFSFYLHEVNTAKIFGFLRVFEPRNLKVNEATACMLGLWHTWGECFDVQGTKWWTMGSCCLVEGLSTFTQWTERPLFMEEGMPLSPCFLFFFLLLLLEEVSMHAQTKLLLQVEELVQEDSRVDQYPKLLKGEQKVVWEWQGLGCCLILWLGGINILHLAQTTWTYQLIFMLNSARSYQSQCIILKEKWITRSSLLARNSVNLIEEICYSCSN